MESNQVPEIISMKVLADLFGLQSASGARRLALRTFPVVRIGKKLFVRRAALLETLERLEVKPIQFPPPTRSPELIAALRRPRRTEIGLGGPRG